MKYELGLNKYASKVKLNLNNVDDIKKFCNLTQTFVSDIDIISDRYICDAKSLMGIFSYDLSKPVTIGLISDDADEIRRFNSVMEDFK
jgi:phosphocarrier protein HPr